MTYQYACTTDSNPTARWVVWSRRPHDPAQAPAIIISSRARPPPKVVQQALDLHTPPPTRPSTPEPVTPVPLPSPPPPPAPPPAVPKKSWASLLRPEHSAGPSSLPTSSVVGFSVPAGASKPSVPAYASHKSELLTLLTTAVTPAIGKIKPRGLVNGGNMCFANSVLQVLLYCPPFHRLFAELGRLLVGANDNNNVNGRDDAANANGKASTTPLVWATSVFLQEFLPVERKTGAAKSRYGGVNGSSGKGKEREFRDDFHDDDDDWDGPSFLPSYVYDAMKTKKRFDTMRGGHQEDAEEFLGFYLDALEEELLEIIHSLNPPAARKAVDEKQNKEEEAAPPAEESGWLEVGRRNRTVVTRTIRAAESPITRIFGGKFRSVLRASGQKDSVVVEDWRSLRLDIQHDQIHTIQEALSYISHPQPVQVTQASRPGVVVEAQQQVLIEAPLPPILVLHVKRFYYDTNAAGVVKVGKHVRYRPELEIGSDVMVPALKRAQPTRYKLFGAVYHHGHSAAGGHYTLDVLHPNRNYLPLPNTHNHNNAKKLPTTTREGWIRIDDELVSDVTPDDVFRTPEEDDNRCAYLLFYRRIP